MSKDTYHHKDLKEALIQNGLFLLNEVGIKDFSLRKVAAMCGVSHAAPYKHFKDKDELIEAINNQVWNSFTLKLEESVSSNVTGSKIQVVEIGKAYVQFMVENPEYLKFMFLSNNDKAIKIENNEFIGHEETSFEVFKNVAQKYLEENGFDKEQQIGAILAMWSMVHGIALLICNNSIKYEGDYLELVEKMLGTSLIKKNKS
ncbi:TetR/AcrR family transcriptional regulator [Clostridium folliculivorans]|uniref:TetR family transcriptional regulator n=1 Tax=Clostridium folliculivorans TaxID=2886038 RepID=A0A9W5Y4X8_9CLOT|nr:TetR/AcrR family transcriptional regulator [Clostridium folliculivorans]GKU26517.1 TetR family transcriptional regulator [Clostridium folliculivorans]GKU29051.1 TetR family transcriptional regulator [Clostridium folliculivorans]